jgi:hypothetical protein
VPALFQTQETLSAWPVYRTQYVGAIRSAIEGTPVNEWDAALDAKYQALVRPRVKSRTPSKSSGAVFDADHAAASSDSGDDDESSDSDADGAAASETKEESDEEANVWLDELDQLLQHYSNCQSWKDVYLAILRNFPEGLSPCQLKFIISQRAKAVHLKPRLKHTKPTWLSLKATNQKYFMQIDHEGKAVLPLSLKDNAPILKLNTRQAYDVPEQAQALFGDSRHVRDASDDIQTQYDLVIPVWRTSGPSGLTNRPFSDSRAGALEYCRTLYDMWEFVFNQSPNRHQESTGVEDIDQTEGFYPCWTPLLLGYTTSNQPIFDGQGREDTGTRTSTNHQGLCRPSEFAYSADSTEYWRRRDSLPEAVRCDQCSEPEPRLFQRNWPLELAA